MRTKTHLCRETRHRSLRFPSQCLSAVSSGSFTRNFSAPPSTALTLKRKHERSKRVTSRDTRCVSDPPSYLVHFNATLSPRWRRESGGEGEVGVLRHNKYAAWTCPRVPMLSISHAHEARPPGLRVPGTWRNEVILKLRRHVRWQSIDRYTESERERESGKASGMESRRRTGRTRPQTMAPVSR